MIIAFGLTSAVMSVLLCKILKYAPRFVFVNAAGLMNTLLMIFLLKWDRTPSYVLIFLFPVVWGAADGIWSTVSASTLILS